MSYYNNIKSQIEHELSRFSHAGCSLPDEKQAIREYHEQYRSDFVEKNRQFWNSNSSLLRNSIIDGSELDINKIRPRLITIDKGDQTARSKLFRLGRFNWSIPTSNGFGRRLRFLVWDEYHDSLIGLIGLTDPVFNMKARDEFVGWNSEARKMRLVSLMDAFTLGALPPYSLLLGGKLVASLLSSDDIHHAFNSRYSDSVGTISKQKKNARLAAITTTSVLGRSSVYNRVKLFNKLILEPIGYTSGYGHFHFNKEMFDIICGVIEENSPETFYSYKFGQGPNWRLRVIREGLKLLGIDQSIMKHGFQRQIFVHRCYENSLDYLARGEPIGELLARSTDEISSTAIQRWIIPRADRRPNYKRFSSKFWFEELDKSVNSK